MTDRSIYDRFHAGEEIAFHPEGFAEGIRARHYDYPMSYNWYERGSWMWKSFNAGWCDEDAVILSEERKRNPYPMQ